MTRKKTHEEYIAELAVKNPAIEVIEEYNGAHTKIMHHCLIHDVYWKATPTRILSGCGCCMCKKDKIHLANAKTHEQYIQEVKNINSNIEVIGKYTDANTPIPHRCLIHDIVWNAFPAVILHGGGCKQCRIEKQSRTKRKTHEQYLTELKSVNPNIIPLEEYKNALTPILHKCLLDGYEWMVAPGYVLYGAGCPKCAGNVPKTHEDYISEVAKINPNIEVAEQYNGANTPILHRCKIDGCEWRATPSDIRRGRGCPKCHESIGERLVALWLNDKNISYIQEKRFDDCRDNKTLPFDFYLPDYNAVIEYQGKQHYESIDYFGGNDNLKYTQYHDKIKSDYCKQNNIRLLCIRYDENIKEALTNFLFI